MACNVPFLRLAAGVALAGVLSCAGASVASAAVVRTPLGAVELEAAEGERNEVTVAQRGAWIYLRDAGAALRARGRCTRLSRHTVRCPSAKVWNVSVFLRDGPDVASLGAPGFYSASVDGGSGRDALSGGKESDVLRGGAGGDRIRGGGAPDLIYPGTGRDRVAGGSGRDTLVDGERVGETDLLNGGRGRDEVNYRAFRGDLDVDLERQPVSVGPDADVLRSIEGVGGGAGDDRLLGDDGRNYLSGATGRDRLVGRGGHDIMSASDGGDRLEGGAGRDFLQAYGGGSALFGGPGNDQLETVFTSERLPADDAARPSTVRCGSGDDDVGTAPYDEIDRCEEAYGWAAALTVETVPHMEDGRAIYRMWCSFSAERCPGVVTLTGTGGRLYGEEQIDVPETDREPAEVPVDLTPAGEVAFAEGRLVRVTFESAPHAEFEDIPPGRVLTFGYTADVGR